MAPGIPGNPGTPGNPGHRGILEAPGAAPGASPGAAASRGLSAEADAAPVPGERPRVLAHGLDSLVVSMAVHWQGEGFLQRLAEAKARAQAAGEAVAIELGGGTSRAPGQPFNVQPQGTRGGYNYLLTSGGLHLRIGHWLEPGQFRGRPGVVAELGSELLWRRGPHAAVDWVRSLVVGQGGHVSEIKASRADLCVDLLVPESVWRMELVDQVVSQAPSLTPYLQHRQLEGIQIGKGQLVARLYDKGREIRQKGEKWWFFDQVWGLAAGEPDGWRVIRVELEFKREQLAKRGAGIVWQALPDAYSGELVEQWPLFGHLANLWAYGTRRWLRVVDDARKRSANQRTVGWWRMVQDGWEGALQAYPAVAERAKATKRKQYRDQVMGQLTSLMALEHQDRGLGELDGLSLEQAALGLIREAVEQGLDEGKLADRVRVKLAEHRRLQAADAQARATRRAYGIGQNLPRPGPAPGAGPGGDWPRAGPVDSQAPSEAPGGCEPPAQPSAQPVPT